ncbi:hypothetical protein BC827DRAFT_28129 [Russula dissimulans]|nr:hypothetical protein BC827DRAFT_28129 [Russula dissimulans]
MAHLRHRASRWGTGEGRAQGGAQHGWIRHLPIEGLLNIYGRLGGALFAPLPPRLALAFLVGQRTRNPILGHLRFSFVAFHFGSVGLCVARRRGARLVGSSGATPTPLIAEWRQQPRKHTLIHAALSIKQVRKYFEAKGVRSARILFASLDSENIRCQSISTPHMLWMNLGYNHRARGVWTALEYVGRVGLIHNGSIMGFLLGHGTLGSVHCRCQLIRLCLISGGCLVGTDIVLTMMPGRA